MVKQSVSTSGVMVSMLENAIKKGEIFEKNNEEMKAPDRDTNHPLFFQNPGYENNNTLLHEIVVQNAKFSKFKENIKDIDEAALETMSLMCNDNGKLAVDLLNRNYDNKIKEYLFLLMKNGSRSSLCTPVEVLMVDPENNANLKLMDNINIAEKVANEVRKNILASSTHPQCNEFGDPEKIRCLKEKICELRSISNYDPQQTKKIAFEWGVGNCGEFSYAAAILLLEIYSKLLESDPQLLKSDSHAVEILRYKSDRGDHVFVALGRDVNSHLNNPHTWGKNAVICDAWAGKIFPATEANLHLRDYRPKKNLNFTIFYNPRWHILLKKKYTASNTCKIS